MLGVLVNLSMRHLAVGFSKVEFLSGWEDLRGVWLGCAKCALGLVRESVMAAGTASLSLCIFSG